MVWVLLIIVAVVASLALLWTYQVWLSDVLDQLMHLGFNTILKSLIMVVFHTILISLVAFYFLYVNNVYVLLAFLSILLAISGLAYFNSQKPKANGDSNSERVAQLRNSPPEPEIFVIQVKNSQFRLRFKQPGEATVKTNSDAGRRLL